MNILLGNRSLHHLAVWAWPLHVHFAALTRDDRCIKTRQRQDDNDAVCFVDCARCALVPAFDLDATGVHSFAGREYLIEIHFRFPASIDNNTFALTDDIDGCANTAKDVDALFDVFIHNYG